MTGDLLDLSPDELPEFSTATRVFGASDALDGIRTMESGGYAVRQIVALGDGGLGGLLVVFQWNRRAAL